MSKTLAQAALRNGGPLSYFMSVSQRAVLLEQLQSEESEYFVQLVCDTLNRVMQTPMTYQTEDIQTADKVLHLHYFKGGIDAWIVERDVGDFGPEHHSAGLGDQWQAYGKITLNGDGWEGAEWGYICIKQLIEHGVELDLYWEPKTAGEMK